MRLIRPIIIAVAWFQMRRVRRASRDMRQARAGLRRADYLATRALRTLIAVGESPIRMTASGVPAMPPMPMPCR